MTLLFSLWKVRDSQRMITNLGLAQSEGVGHSIRGQVDHFTMWNRINCSTSHFSTKLQTVLRLIKIETTNALIGGETEKNSSYHLILSWAATAEVTDQLIATKTLSLLTKCNWVSVFQTKSCKSSLPWSLWWMRQDFKRVKASTRSVRQFTLNSVIKKVCRKIRKWLESRRDH